MSDLLQFVDELRWGHHLLLALLSSAQITGVCHSHTPQTTAPESAETLQQLTVQGIREPARLLSTTLLKTKVHKKREIKSQTQRCLHSHARSLRKPRMKNFAPKNINVSPSWRQRVLKPVKVARVCAVRTNIKIRGDAYIQSYGKTCNFYDCMTVCLWFIYLILLVLF